MEAIGGEAEGDSGLGVDSDDAVLGGELESVLTIADGGVESG